MYTASPAHPWMQRAQCKGFEPLWVLVSAGVLELSPRGYLGAAQLYLELLLAT